MKSKFDYLLRPGSFVPRQITGLIFAAKEKRA